MFDLYGALGRLRENQLPRKFFEPVVLRTAVLAYVAEIDICSEHGL